MTARSHLKRALIFIHKVANQSTCLHVDWYKLLQRNLMRSSLWLHETAPGGGGPKTRTPIDSIPLVEFTLIFKRGVKTAPPDQVGRRSHLKLLGVMGFVLVVCKLAWYDDGVCVWWFQVRTGPHLKDGWCEGVGCEGC